MKIPRVLLSTGVAAALALSASACSTTTDSSSSTVTLALDWLAQPTNAGAYIAQEKGYYEQADIEVNIQPGGTEASSVKIVSGGGAQFGLEYGGPILQARSKGIDIVALAPTLQKSPAVFVFHKGQPITSLSDLQGRTVYTQPSTPEWEYTVKEYGLTEVTAVQFQGNYAPFARDETAVAQGYATSTPATLAAQGIAVGSIPRASHNDYGSVLFTTQKLIDENPDLVRKFVAATVQGWAYIRNNPDESAQLLSKYVEDADVTELIAEFRAQEPFIWTTAAQDRFGWQDAERWQDIYDFQHDIGTVDDPAVLDGAWTTDFLPQS